LIGGGERAGLMRKQKRKATKRPRPAPLYLIARGPRPHTIGHAHDDEALDWKLTIAPLGSPPTEVPARPARIQREVREWLVFDSQSLREANSKGEPLTPFPPKTPPGSPKKWLVSTGPGARFEALRRRPGAEKIAALERDQEMKDWYLNDVYQELATFHVSSTRRGLRPRPFAMPAAVMRWVRQWRKDLRAALKETGLPIDRVPTDCGQTLDYTLTKWTFENIHRAPLWRRDEAILRREKQLANRSQALASQRGEEKAEDYKKWKLWLSDLADAAEIRLGEKPGATLGVKGMKRKRRPKTDHLPLIFRLSEIYKRRPAEEILRAEGFSLQASVSSLLKETAIYAAVAARLGLIEGRSLEVAKRGAKIIRSRLDRDPLR
jgi:hypothetical protein